MAKVMQLSFTMTALLHPLAVLSSPTIRRGDTRRLELF
jgi:hypothetical protein